MTYQLVHQMQREGFSIQRIADHLGMNWRTAKRLLDLSEQEYLFAIEQIKGRKKSLEGYQEFVNDKLVKYPATSAPQMHDWLKEHHDEFPHTSRGTVFNFVQSVRNKLIFPKPSR